MNQALHRYSTGAIALHWIMAVLVIGQILLVWAGDLAGDNARMFRDAHKANGMMLLVLTLVRIGWRLTHRVPPLPGDTPRWQAFAARATQVLFYGLLLVMPLSGWIASSAAGRDIGIHGLFNWPLLPVGGGRETAGMVMDVHRAGAKLLYGLLVLHIGGALHHHLIRRDDVLRSMLPAPRRGPG